MERAVPIPAILGVSEGGSKESGTIVQVFGLTSFICAVVLQITLFETSPITCQQIAALLRDHKPYKAETVWMISC